MELVELTDSRKRMDDILRDSKRANDPKTPIAAGRTVYVTMICEFLRPGLWQFVKTPLLFVIHTTAAVTVGAAKNQAVRCCLDNMLTEGNWLPRWSRLQARLRPV
jgi:hypothetical protein